MISSLTVILRDLEPLGTPRVYLDLLPRLAERGIRSTVVAGGGDLAREMREHGVETVAADWARARSETLALVDTGSDATIVLCDPLLAHTVPAALAASGRIVLAVHSDAPGLAEWFGPGGMERIATLARGMAASGSGALVARGPAHARSVAAALGVEESDLHPIRSGIATEQIPFEPGGGEPGEVLLMTRLHPDALRRVEAAVSLVAGEPALRLRLVGGGQAEVEALSICRARLGERFRHDGPTLDPQAEIRRASVVVGSGRTALEAAAAGRRVVLVREGGGGVLGPVLTPSTFQAFSEDTMAVPLPPCEPREVLATLARTGEVELAAVRRLVEAHHSGAAQAEGFLRVLTALEPLPAEARGPLAAVARIAALAEDGEARAEATATELWRAREWYEEQLDWARRRLEPLGLPAPPPRP